MQYFLHALSNLQGIAMNSDLVHYAVCSCCDLQSELWLYTKYWFLDGYLKTALSPNGSEHIATVTMKYNIIAFLQH